MAVFRISSMQSCLVICLYSFLFPLNFNLITVDTKYLGLTMHVFLTELNENVDTSYLFLIQQKAFLLNFVHNLTILVERMNQFSSCLF